jgi:carboxymethylenebutenolidase
MTNLQVSTQKVSIDSGADRISAYLATPVEPGTFPGIIVIQEVFGVNAYIQAVTERVASMGYVAIAPAIFARQAPGFEVGYSAAELELGRSYAGQTQAPELLADVGGAIDYLQSLPQVRSNFGCIGFCFGGHVAYLAATLPQIQATASLLWQQNYQLYSWWW